MPLQAWAMSDFTWPDAAHRPDRDRDYEIDGGDS